MLIECNAGLMLDHLYAGSLLKAHQSLAKLLIAAETRIERWIFDITHLFGATFELLW